MENVEESNQTKRTRKRLRNENNWKRKKAKALRNSGKAYTNSKRKEVKERSVQPYEHTCRYQCRKISDDDRKSVFTDFWGLQSWNLQSSFINGCMESCVPKNPLRNAQKHRQKSVCLKLLGKRVCKSFFLKTLDISQKRYDNVLKKKEISGTGVSPVDKRGKHVPRNKISDEKIKHIKKHIESFPKATSHYSRTKNPDTKYLESNLDIKKMYKLYVDLCKEEGIDPVKESYYRHIFVTQFNLTFKAPRSDTCNKCDALEMKIKFGTNQEIIDKSKAEKEHHLTEAENARTAKKKAQEKSIEDPTVVAICFDLQKTLPTPMLTCNRVYYARQLWTYNLAVHDLSKKCATMLMWTEAEASRGSQEIGSCLLKYVLNLPKTVKHIIAFSDNCGGQNKSQYITRFWMYIVKNTHIETVDHKFLVAGHSYMECDEDFGLIEKTKKNLQFVFVPDDWVSAVASANRKFRVVRMNTDDFLSVEEMCDNLKDSVVGISKFQWLRYVKSDPFVVLYKKSVNETEPFKSYEMKKPKIGRPCENFTLKPLYSSPLVIDTAKYKDLQTLLEFVPPIHHQYYKNLKHGKKERKKKQPPKESTSTTTVEDNVSASDLELDLMWESE